MAVILDDFVFPAGRRPTYPWTVWQSGHTYQIGQGADFDCTATSMQAQLYVRAKKRGMKVTTSLSGPVGAEDTVTFKFAPLVPGVDCG